MLGAQTILYTTGGTLDNLALAVNRDTGRIVLAIRDGNMIVIKEFNGTASPPISLIWTGKPFRPALAMNKSGKYFVGFLFQFLPSDNDVYGAIGQM